MPSTPQKDIAEWLARTLLAGEPTRAAAVSRCELMLGRSWPWLTPLISRYLKAFANQTRPRRSEVIAFLQGDAGLASALKKHGSAIEIRQIPLEAQQMQPVVVAASWGITPISTLHALCGWLRLEPGELEWFADLKMLAARPAETRLEHYHYRVLAKVSGSLRLIEIPKPRLKQLQRTILTDVLEKVPPHPAAHGFVKGRSIQSFVKPHVHKTVVLRMDMADFFPSIRFARVEAMFRTLGYPESIARLLAGICTNAVPRRVWDTHISPDDRMRTSLRAASALHRESHLPQGAPTSPALANICSYRLDCRLAGLAAAAGAAYSRYADDLAFSGGSDFERAIGPFAARTAAILMEEGFLANHRKTRIMRQGVRQHLAGLVVNQRMNTGRRETDALKAILTNCARLGPAGENRKALTHFKDHLEGRVGFVESINARKGQKLRRLFNEIIW